MMAHLTCTIVDEVAVVVFDNPPQNRLAPQFADEFEEALTKAGGSGARALLLRAEGPNFCLGGDIAPWPEMGAHELRSMFGRFLAAFNRFERLPIPTIAAVQGGCIGGGLELAMRADIIIAGETARFAHPEASLGLVSLLGGVYRLAERVGRSKAMEIVLTGEQVSSQQMERLGVVYRVVPDADLLKEATVMAGRLASGATRAHAAHKALLRAWASGGTAVADEAILDIGMPLFESEDVRLALPAAADLLKAGKPRSAFHFQGR